MKKLTMAAALGALAMGYAGSASAAIIFETGADGPANKNVDWIEEATGNGDMKVFGFINGTNIDVLATGSEDLKTTGNGVVWITGTDGNLTHLTYTLPGHTFTAFEVDLKDPTGNNPTWTVTFKTDSGASQVFNNFNGGFISAYVDPNGPAMTITSVEFTTSASIAGTGQTRFGGIQAVGVPEPATWALMLAGFGGAGAMLRRRRTAPRPA